MAEYSREELLKMLDETEPATAARTFEVRDRVVTVDDAALKSWRTVTRISEMQHMDGLNATVELMGIVTDCTDLEQADVLDMCGGPMADFGDVTELLAEMAGKLFPKG
jgi:hypothetical protein